LAKTHFERRGLTVLPWPPNSPDLNIIEHCWNELKRRIYRRSRHPTTLGALVDAAKGEWVDVEQDFVETLYESMPRRMAAVIKAKGGNTKYSEGDLILSQFQVATKAPQRNGPDSGPPWHLTRSTFPADKPAASQE